MGKNNFDAEKERIKEKANNVEDIFIMKVYDRYRLNLVKDFRKLLEIKEGDLIVILNESISSCPYCAKPIKLPGLRMFALKADDLSVVIDEGKDVGSFKTPSVTIS